MGQFKCKKARLARSPSRWVYAFGISCADEFFVWYNHGEEIIARLPAGPGRYLGVGGSPGICCVYPGVKGALAEKYYQLSAVFPYAGEFVHRFLYKKQPYQVVPGPELPCPGCDIVTVCCPNGIPPQLFVTLFPTLGCGCVSGSFPINWDGARWIGTGDFGCGGRAITVSHYCTAILPPGDCHDFRSDFSMSDGCGSLSGSIPNPGCTCTPPSWTYPGANGPACGCPGIADAWSYVITQ